MGKGYLLLETGDLFEGELIGSKREMMGEVVFNTNMTGYQEMITDPSYAGQILTFCYPLIGNCGINLADNESIQPQLRAIIVGELCQDPSHYLASLSFDEQLQKAGVSGLAGVDTRALVKRIRQQGTVKGLITNQSSQDIASIKEVFNQESSFMQGENTCWVDKVSTQEIKTYENVGPHVMLMDYGYKKSILDALLQAGCQVTIVPYSFTYQEVSSLHPDGVLFSNGPGNPMELQAWFSEIRKISRTYPSLGIALGHQLLALAHGAQSKKLENGHRGNYPVKDMETGKVYMTAQNHGYVVLDESIDQDVFRVTHRNVHDGSIEGLKHAHLPLQSVQFYPEAHPGPSDTATIFESFMEQLVHTGEMKYALK